ncbi:MAG: amidohydrolase [Candidatus Eremiobacteraeota bacterium]|nr:amidohydrolase [Candidatus Eremiobacteraeota bacterium]
METLEKTIAPDIVARTVEVRRLIHRQPELGFEEERTAALVESELDAIGVEHRRVAKTGVVGIVRGAKPGHVIGLRADMDALPVLEQSGEPFSSEVPGKMHACGHDAHTAMLLGVARELTRTKSDLAGTTVLLFQPAEEGPGGALPMIEAGVMDDPKIEAVAMLHVDNRLDVGVIGVTPGVVNAAADEFFVTITGVGGHGAAPHRAVDAIPCAAATVLALQNIAARETDPLATVVVTVGTINGGYRHNIIADSVKMSGTFRSQDASVRDKLEERARRIIENVAAAYNCKASLQVTYLYPPVHNDEHLAVEFTDEMHETHPAIDVQRAPATMGGEDFAYFAQRAPGLLIRLGIRNEAAGITHSGHSPKFRIDERAFPVGIATLVAFARAGGEGRILAH